MSVSFLFLKNGLIVKDAAGLAVKCECAPCPSKWYIATYCACTICGADRPACSIGGSCAYPTDPTDPLYDASVAGDDVTIDGDEVLHAMTIEKNTSGEENNFNDNCITVSNGCWLRAIKHTTSAAPFNGECRADVYINGDSVGSWTGACTEGETLAVGSAIFDEGVPFAAIPCKVAVGSGTAYARFTVNGMNHVDLRITFTQDEASGDDVETYSCRLGIRVIGGEVDGVGVGMNPFVVPEWLLRQPWAQCPYTNEDGVPLQVVSVMTDDGITPTGYDTKADADYVLANWTTDINYWAKYCRCREDCIQDLLIIDYAVDDGTAGPYECFDHGGIEYPESSFGCANGWMAYEFILLDGSAWGHTMIAREYDEDGNFTVLAYGPGHYEGVIPPCHYVKFFVATTSPDTLIDDYGESPLHGSFWVAYLEDPCEMDFADFLYDSTDGTGVPFDSDTLANYLENWA